MGGHGGQGTGGVASGMGGQGSGGVSPGAGGAGGQGTAGTQSQGGPSSCSTQPDGARLTDGELCCGGFPIAATANGKCPALFQGNATGVSAAPIVGAAATPSGHGYWLVGADGGVFSFGGAPFEGSLPGQHVSVSNIVGITASPQGNGYWLIGADGGVFSFGTSAYYASNALHDSSAPIVSMTTSGSVFGYWMVANDGEVFVAPNAPPESSSIPAIGTSEPYLGEMGSFEITVWDSSGQRNCNEGPFAQIPGDPTHVIGRYSNTCTGSSSWSLARWSVDWTSHRLTFENMIFDTRGGSVPISGGNALSTYYDATIASYGGELWVAGECGGQIAGAGTACACIGPLSSSSWTMDPSRTNVAILGNQSLNDGFIYSASVPKLLEFHGGLYLYWSAVKIQASNGMWAAITERGTQLAEFPSQGGRLWAARFGNGIGSADPTYTDEVWGLGMTSSDNVVADIGGIFTDGTSVFANGSIAGAACSNPFWPPTCYSIAFAKSANPLGNDIFDTGSVLPMNELTTSPGGELRLFTDPNQVNYLWGSYFTNVTGPRPMQLMGMPNAGYLLGYAIPSGTPFFGSL